MHCTYDPETKRGGPQAGRKVKGTIHWVSASHAVKAEVRLYDYLFTIPDPANDKEGRDYRTFLSPKSLQVLTGCQVEPSLASAGPDTRYQFERQGYFCLDLVDSSPDGLVFNRTVALRDSWAKIAQSGD